MLITGDKDTSDKHNVDNFFANFRKICNDSYGVLRGPEEKRIHEKTWTRKSYRVLFCTTARDSVITNQRTATGTQEANTWRKKRSKHMKLSLRSLESVSNFILTINLDYMVHRNRTGLVQTWQISKINTRRRIQTLPPPLSRHWGMERGIKNALLNSQSVLRDGGGGGVPFILFLFIWTHNPTA